MMRTFSYAQNGHTTYTEGSAYASGAYHTLYCTQKIPPFEFGLEGTECINCGREKHHVAKYLPKIGLHIEYPRYENSICVSLALQLRDYKIGSIAEDCIIASCAFPTTSSAAAVAGRPFNLTSSHKERHSNTNPL
jgi:hypothetical protein